MLKGYFADVKDGANKKDPNFFVRMIKKFRSLYEKFISKYNLMSDKDYKKKNIFKRILYRIAKFIDKLAYKLQTLVDRRSDDQKSRTELIDDFYDKNLHGKMSYKDKTNNKRKLDIDDLINNPHDSINIKKAQTRFTQKMQNIKKGINQQSDKINSVLKGDYFTPMKTKKGKTIRTEKEFFDFMENNNNDDALIL